MAIVNVHQAKAQFSTLLARAEAGEQIIIVRRGKPPARLIGCELDGKRQPDVLRGKITIPDSFFDPLPDDELSSWEG